LTHGAGLSPRAFALRASTPAAIIARGLDVLVQLVIAAMTTAPSSSVFALCGTAEAIPLAFRFEVEIRWWGFMGPAIERAMLPKSSSSTRSYFAPVSVSAHSIRFDELALLH
jgi:hypothetical protein